MSDYIVKRIKRTGVKHTIKFDWSYLYGDHKMSAETFGNLFTKWCKQLGYDYDVANSIRLYAIIHHQTPTLTSIHKMEVNDNLTVEYINKDFVVISYARCHFRYNYVRL